MYDYDRRDKYGNPRELHVKKALDVVDTKAYVKDNTTEVMLEENEHYSLERLVQCKYFECLKYEIKDEVKIVADESSFVSLVFIEGSGTIEADDYKQEVPFKAGESFFVSSGKRSINIKGKGTWLGNTWYKYTKCIYICGYMDTMVIMVSPHQLRAYDSKIKRQVSDEKRQVRRQGLCFTVQVLYWYYFI